jgi:hypothetical protein
MSDTPDKSVSDFARVFALDEWNTRYHHSLKDHLHALGVVAANFNHLEFALLALFYIFAGLDDGTAQHLFSYLKNDKRVDILLRSIKARETDPDVNDRATHFTKGFNVCAENRNYLMHSMTEEPSGTALTVTSIVQDTLILRKATRGDPTKRNYLHLNLTEIRQAADDIYAFDLFGLKLWRFVNQRKLGRPNDGNDATAPLSLPEKPLLPNKLIPSDSPIPKIDSPQPQSSRE